MKTGWTLSLLLAMAGSVLAQTIEYDSVSRTLTIKGTDKRDAATVWQFLSEGKTLVLLVTKDINGKVVSSINRTYTVPIQKIVFHGYGENDRFENSSWIPSEAYGGDGNDVLNGGLGNDRLFGGAGVDRIYGDMGDDYLDGGDDTDFITGGPGNDTILGGAGDDILNGQAGNDILYGGDGNDVLYGESGDDKLYGGPGVDELDGGSGTNVLKQD
jgi:hypothetical protein